MRNKTKMLSQSALIAALYVVFTFVSSWLGLGEFRLSEALTVLPFFTAAAVPGLTVGCLLANILTGCNWLDVLFGTAATAIGAAGAAWVTRKSPEKWAQYLAPWPNIIANTVIIPILLKYVYVGAGSLIFYIGTVFISEFVTGGVLGFLLLRVLERRKSVFR